MSGITVRAARGEEFRDLVALACAWHGRAEDGMAWRWRYQGYPLGPVATFLGVTAAGRIEAGCGVLPREVELPDGSTVPAGLVVDLGCGWSPVAQDALVAVLAAAEAECFGVRGMRHLVLPAGPVPAACGAPTVQIQDVALAPPGWFARWQLPAPIELEPGDTVPVPARVASGAARLRRTLPWLQFRFRDRPRVRGPLLLAGRGADAWHVGIELHEEHARLWPADLDAERIERVVAQVRRKHPTVRQVRVARPVDAARLRHATPVGAPIPVWIRSAAGALPVARWYVDLEDLPLEQSTLGGPVS